jgi:hypothetical protein
MYVILRRQNSQVLMYQVLISRAMRETSFFVLVVKNIAKYLHRETNKIHFTYTHAITITKYQWLQ